jgi:hypothetical protein
MCGKNNLIEIKEQFDTLAKYQPYFNDHCCTTNFSMFKQTWSNTSLGFNGIGGDALTDALTIVIPRDKKFDVFFGGLYAYTVPENTNGDLTYTKEFQRFREDMMNTNLSSVDTAKKRYGAYIDEYVAGCYPGRFQ